MLNTLRVAVLLPLGLCGTVAMGQAATPDPADTLFDALQLADIIAIMREEGVDYGQDIDTDLLSSRGGAGWADTVDDIYDVDAMTDLVKRELAANLDGDSVDPAIAFFEGTLGQQIISLEVSARRALLDEALDEAAKDAATIAMADRTDRFVQLETFVTVNDLIETNVVGALNANYAFMTGLESGLMSQTATEEEILSDVWQQEPDIRRNTTEWVYSFLNMAYQPLDDAELDAYIAFSDTEAGQALNAAMFAAFDAMFTDISAQLGRESAVVLSGQDI